MNTDVLLTHCGGNHDAESVQSDFFAALDILDPDRTLHVKYAVFQDDRDRQGRSIWERLADFLNGKGCDDPKTFFLVNVNPRRFTSPLVLCSDVAWEKYIKALEETVENFIRDLTPAFNIIKNRIRYWASYNLNAAKLVACLLEDDEVPKIYLYAYLRESKIEVPPALEDVMDKKYYLYKKIILRLSS